MEGKKQILNLIKKYIMTLGYSCKKVEQLVSVEGLSELIVLNLADSNVVLNNKKGKGHQTHIAITGESIAFFYSKINFDKMDCELIDTVQMNMIENNVRQLRGENDFEKNEDILFNNVIITIGKRTQQQVQLSKNIAKNSKEFNELRECLYANDLLIMMKCREQDKMIVLGIKKSFYERYIPQYELHYNSNLYICFNYNVEKEDERTNTEKVYFDIYTEKTTDDSANCYFCGCTLEEYMENIPETYRDNEIQRGIVKNVYLDRLVQTIIRNDSIPTITLVSEDIELLNDAKKLAVSQYRILDGLQRTYKIHEIWKCMKMFFNVEDKDALLELNRIRLARKLSDNLKKNNCDISVFLQILEEYRRNKSIDRFWNYYKSNVQWFEIWEGLTPEQETQKMLVLNAGHKQMDIRHQLELLYLNNLPDLNQLCQENGCKGIIRNKDKSDMQYSKDRIQGEFYFSHIISATISFSRKNAVTTNADLVNSLQQDSYDEKIDYNQLINIMTFLIKFDKAIEHDYHEAGVKWIARETVLVGLFAALGKYNEKDDAFGKMLTKIGGLNLSSYEKEKNENIEISKVNVGNITKNAVKNAILDLLNGVITSINWGKYFGGNVK